MQTQSLSMTTRWMGMLTGKSLRINNNNNIVNNNNNYNNSYNNIDNNNDNNKNDNNNDVLYFIRVTWSNTRFEFRCGPQI